MKVFLCWSGDRSKQIASALHTWLPSVIQSVEPFMSQHDIDSGARWLPELNNKLATHHFGILCLTPENITAEWILFEAGALSKSLEKARVVPYLFDLNPTDIKDPLAQFQYRKANQEDTKTLIQSINKASENPIDKDILTASFEKWWPDLKNILNEIPDRPDEAKAIERSENELLEEILQHVRKLPTTFTKILTDSNPETSTVSDDDIDHIRNLKHRFGRLQKEYHHAIELKKYKTAKSILVECEAIIDVIHPVATTKNDLYWLEKSTIEVNSLLDIKNE